MLILLSEETRKLINNPKENTFKNPMENITIQKVTLNDVNQLQKIGRLTFSETFSGDNSEEDMKKYLDENFSVEKLTEELNNKNSEFYFALLDNTVIGYLKLNFGESQTELKDNKALEIERIYVPKEYHGQSVGQILYEKAIQVAKQKDTDYVWLGVWEENLRALSFYKKNGFIEFDKHIFKLGNDEQTDIMMKLQLKDQ
jgi:ribosomal protein S18 acetylase RimI-like enzyme